MPLSSGIRLGPYSILSPLGAGGMGEVYRAKDTRLDREVAIKVMPAALARDPERLARFDREAKALASLNHPNIATIYGLEESPEGKAIAMELVNGATLKSPQPLDEALRIALQIAEALEAAHEKGITHRDLKPANIMVTSAGLVKVLDCRTGRSGDHAFRVRRGLAYLYDGEDGSRHHHGHRSLHVAGAGGGQDGRPALRCVVVRSCAVRDADGEAAVPRRDGVVHAGGCAARRDRF